MLVGFPLNPLNQMRHVVYGGQFGSEGKGNVSEFLVKSFPGVNKVIAIGENSPNSGHTCTRGKTRNIPAASYFASAAFLGPDSVIDIDVIKKDIEVVKFFNPEFRVYVHEHAAIVNPDAVEMEDNMSLKSRIGSTQTGSGYARHQKHMYRDVGCIVRGLYNPEELPFKVLTREDWMKFVSEVNTSEDVLFIFECSQGIMLDVNLGYYPFVTSRSTIPQVALSRNGFDPMMWHYCGVYRTFPIRTGGNTGPTGAEELTWESLKLAAEIATVTGRTRRIFKWSQDDFEFSLQVCLPEFIFITHCDYIIEDTDLMAFLKNIKSKMSEFTNDDADEEEPAFKIFASRKPSEFGIVEI